MSLDQSTEVAAGARRRIVALPTRVEAPVALIMREAEQREALADHVGRRRAVSFPSLAHFCTEEQRRQPWLGIIVGYSCAWDAQLERFVPHPSCISLYQVAEEGHGWPEGVQRIAERDQLDAWLRDLAEPMPAWKRALEEARKKPRKPRRAPAKREAPPTQQLSLPMAEKADQAAAGSLGSFSHRGRKEPAATQKVVTKRVVKSREAAPRPAPQAKSPAPASKDTRRVVRLSASEIAKASRAGAHLPKELIRLAGEIGFARAEELLSGLRQNARALTRAGR